MKYFFKSKLEHPAGTSLISVKNDIISKKILSLTFNISLWGFQFFTGADSTSVLYKFISYLGVII